MTDTTNPAGGPTVVLVHGAFADAGSWSQVTQRLVAAGVPVRAIVNPLRGVAADSAYVASAISQTPGPVLAVGHSYGGAVITNACTRTDNVVGLVYVAAFAPDEGEQLGELVGGSQDSILIRAVQETRYPTGDGSESAAELSIDPARFREVFTADLPQLQSDVLAVSQRPIAASTFGEKSGPPAWRNLPTWAAVGTADKAAGSDIVRSMAQRAQADITEIDGSHVIMISRPEAVTDVILKALKAVSG
ncbi:MAG TPA: alpha/beta hydrolase [Pseudonocardia sp.]|jgi:pimeloyl-ACP methyl ester carboxylesterase